MSGAILLVTWFLGQGQVQSYQVQFTNLALCANAMGLLRADTDSLAQKIEQDSRNALQASGVKLLSGPMRPSLSAICVQG
jgi:hypothetical protein